MGTEPRDTGPQDPGDQEPGAQDRELSGASPSSEGVPEDLDRQDEASQADRYLSYWQRAEADMANLRRRNEQERAELARFANATLIGKVLPVLDDFERAVATIPEEVGSSGWVEGVRIIEKKLKGILESEGVTPIEALGREFDPHVHQAVMQDDGDGDTDVVVEEYQKGYKLHDRVIRPTMVKVGRGNPASDKKRKER